jgi:hypothetical protein
LCALECLESLWLNHNSLSGEIPAAIGDLSRLEELFLNDNALKGVIPSGVGK